MRAYNQIKELSKNHEVSLFCISHTRVEEEHIAHLKEFCKEIRVVRPRRLTSYKNVVRNFTQCKSLQVGYWNSKKARKEYRHFERLVNPDVIYSQMVRTIPLVKDSHYPKVMDYQDALSLNVLRRMMKTRRGLMHFVLHFEFKMLRSLEYNAFGIFDDLCIISEKDSESIPHMMNHEIKIVPNGVDASYYQPKADTEKQYDVVFCGNMQYHPNVNAAQYLVKEIMPRVWKEKPDAKVLIAGADPKSAVRNMASKNVTISGWVEDIRECYSQSKIFCAPMQMGSGLQNKLLEAMSMELPCITSPLANDALKAEENHSIMVCETPKDYSEMILMLLENSTERNRLAQAGNQFVKEHYSWEQTGKDLEAILQNAIQNHKEHTTQTSL